MHTESKPKDSEGRPKVLTLTTSDSGCSLKILKSISPSRVPVSRKIPGPCFGIRRTSSAKRKRSRKQGTREVGRNI